MAGIGGKVDPVSVGILADQLQFQQALQLPVDDRGAQPRFTRQLAQLKGRSIRREKQPQNLRAALRADDPLQNIH